MHVNFFVAWSRTLYTALIVSLSRMLWPSLCSSMSPAIHDDHESAEPHQAKDESSGA
jgi:hypothetical protein